MFPVGIVKEQVSKTYFSSKLPIITGKMLCSLMNRISFHKITLKKARKEKYEKSGIPVDARRRFNVDTTSCDIARRPIKVETT